MREVELRSNEGHFVARVDVPAVVGRQKLIVWWGRAFVLCDELGGIVPMYQEIQAETSLTPWPGRARPNEIQETG